jgi:hypothetical protein
MFWSQASIFHVASLRGLRPRAVASDIWQLPEQFHCFSLGPEVASSRLIAERKLQELAGLSQI